MAETPNKNVLGCQVEVDDGSSHQPREGQAVADHLEVLAGGTERRAGNILTAVPPYNHSHSLKESAQY